MALPVGGYMRGRMARHAGVRFASATKDCRVFIGQNVQLDSEHPEDIFIGNWSTIATGCVILTHYLEPDAADWPYFNHRRGHVHIGTGCFIGANSVICKPVTIGDGAIVAAGSVVLKDIPEMEIWGGNPARFLKKRNPLNRMPDRQVK